MSNYDNIERKIAKYENEIMNLESDKRYLEIKIDSGCYDDKLEDLEDELIAIESYIEDIEWNLEQLLSHGKEE